MSTPIISGTAVAPSDLFDSGGLIGAAPVADPLPAGWKFFLCRSSDMVRLGEIRKSSSRSLQVLLDRAGSYSASISMHDPCASMVEVGTTCIEAVKNGVTVWSGPIQSAQYSYPNIGIQCIGWFELLRSRLVRDGGLVDAVTNGSFEPSLAGWTEMEPDLGIASSSTTTPRSGSRNLKLDGSDPDTSYVGAYQVVGGLRVGSVVTITAYVRWGPLSTGGLASLYIADSSSPDSFFAPIARVFDTTASKTSYTELHLSWVATSTTVAVGVVYEGDSSANNIAYVDDVSAKFESINFTNVDIGEIALSLVDAANRWDTCPVTRGTAQASWNRTVRFIPFQNIGDEIQRMSDVENGFDFEVDPVTRDLDIFYPMKGIFRGNYDAPQIAITKSNPSYYWNFDSGINNPTETSVTGLPLDLSSSANTWAVAPTLCSSGTGFGKKTSAIATAGGYFAGIGSFPAGLDLGAQTWSFATLFKVSTLVNVTQLYLISTGDGAVNQGVQVMANGSINAYIANGLTLTAPAATIVAGNTYHVAVTFDAATKIGTLYVNGVVVSSGKATAAWPKFATDGIGMARWSYLGMRFSGAGTPDVTMDEIAFWDGRALSLSEITFQYQSLRTRTDLMPGGVKFGYGDRGPRNLSTVNKLVDQQGMTNWMVTQGKGSSVGGGALARDPASIAAYGARDEVAQLSQTDSVQILAAYSNAEIAVRSTPRILYEMVPKVATTTNSVPSPFIDYDVGDIVSFDALVQARDNEPTSPTYGQVLYKPIDVVDQNVRIFGIQVSFDSAGNEKVTLTTAPGN